MKQQPNRQLAIFFKYRRENDDNLLTYRVEKVHFLHLKLRPDYVNFENKFKIKMNWIVYNKKKNSTPIYI